MVHVSYNSVSIGCLTAVYWVLTLPSRNGAPIASANRSDVSLKCIVAGEVRARPSKDMIEGDRLLDFFPKMPDVGSLIF